MAMYKETSMSAIFQNQAEKYGDRDCVAYKKDGEYTDISWKRINEMVLDTAAFLLDQGIKKGDRVGLFSPNRYEWFVADMAIGSIGAVNVPIYSTNSPMEAQYILENSGSKFCFVADQEFIDRVMKVKKKLPSLKGLLSFDAPEKKKKDVTSLADAMEKGSKSKSRSQISTKIKANKPDDLATIMYTSGTTGNPKGVMLTNNNFVSNVKNIMMVINEYIDDTEVFLSFLPLSHSLERTAGYYFPVYLGAKIAYAEDISTIQQNLQEVRPTIIISVPRIYEKVHAGILAKVSDASAVKKAIFNWAVKTAQKNLPYELREEKKRGPLFSKRFNLADKLVFSGLKETLGLDRLKFAISGGGPLSVSDAEFFIGMGVTILEGFGLTETTPVTNANLPRLIKPGTVGPPIPETDIKLSDEGEILIKGPQIMKGYYKDKKATDEVTTKDGYFRTGDIGVIDEDGYLAITGRIKDIIVTAGGKNISPQNIENDLKTSKYIEQVAVIGDKRKFLSALIIPNMEELKKWAKKNEIDTSDTKALCEDPRAKEMIQGVIDKIMNKYARVEQIRKFTLMDTEWTQETGELTPTQKVKRRIVEEKYAEEIEAMYADESAE